MSGETPEILDAVAGIVADFAPIDWESVTAQHEGLADTLAALRQLKGIASGHREAIRTEASGTVESSLAQVSANHAMPGTAASPEAGSRGLHADLPFTWGPLIVQEKLASGGRGDVYRAYDAKLQRHVALKLQPSSSVQHAGLTEARRLARVRHANVLSVHGADLFGGLVGIWTDLVRGQTLDERLRREGPIHATEAALIGIDLSRALRAVHDAGLVHGDVKAANVMRDEEGTIVLLDFGSARVLEDSEERISGTPLVMAPEVLLGEDPSPVSDLYSLGVLLYRLVSGEYPTEAATVEELADKHRLGEALPLSTRRPGLEASFVQIVETALRREPAERFAGAREMEIAFEAFLEAARDGHPSHVSSASHNLPRESSTFIGRERPIRQLKRLLQDHDLVTITGTGGSGKTRLALQVAASVLTGHFHEIRWVELAASSDLARARHEIAMAFGLRDTTRGLSTLLSERLRHRTALLVLDNCEHLVDECGSITAELLRVVAGLTVMTTSREPLGISGEIVYSLAPLELPTEAWVAAGEIREIESVALFLDRAAATGVSLVLDEESAPLLLRICERLEGLPLAIELAAARVRSLSLAQILTRLDDRFRLLTGGPSGRPRHQALRALIDWSYGLLAEQEKRLFMRLGIFSGGWTLDAAVRVATGGGIHPDEILDLTQRLLDKCLIERLPGPAGSDARYRMLETIREYARGCLSQSGEVERVTRRHREYYAGIAREAVSHLRSSREKQGMSRVREELGNVRAAMESGLAETSVGMTTGSQIITQLGADMARLWFGLDLWTEGRGYCVRFLSRPDPEGNDSVCRLHLCVSAGFLAVQQGDFVESARLFDEAVRIAEERNETSLLQTALAYQGNLAFTQGRCIEARKYQERALALARELDDPRRISVALSNLGNVLELLGAQAEARRSHEESLEWARQAGDARSMAYTLGRLGEAALQAGTPDEAQRFLEESLALRREIVDRWGIAAASTGLADVHVRIGASSRAKELLEESAAIFEELGDAGSLARTFGRMAEVAMSVGELELARSNVEKTLRIVAGLGERRDFANNLALLATIENATGETEVACRLLGAAERVYGELDGPPMPSALQKMAAQRAELATALGEQACADLVAEGNALDDAALLAIATASGRIT